MSRQQIQLFNNDSLNVNVKTVTDDNNNIWFRGKDVALFLGYANTAESIKDRVDDEYKRKLPLLMEKIGGSAELCLTFNEKNTVYISEPGLYQLIFSSKKPEAKIFTKWIVEDVIPSIRKTGKYSIAQPPLLCNQISLMNEKDLHYKVIDYIRKYYPHALLYAGLGELQTTSESRIHAYKSGYQKGTSDIIINNLHKSYNGLTIELKTPNGRGVASSSQLAFLDRSKVNGHKILLSNDYDEIITEIIKYMSETRILCTCCDRKFKNDNTLRNHLKYIHRITNL